MSALAVDHQGGHDFVVADEDCDVSTDGACLLLQPDQQLEGLSSSATSVEHVAELDEVAGAALPAVVRVDEPRSEQEDSEPVGRSVEVSNDNDPGGKGPRGGNKNLLFRSECIVGG